MLHEVVQVAALATPAALTLTLLAATLTRAGARTRTLALAAGVGAASGLVLAVLRSTTALVNRERVTLTVVAVLLIAEAALMIHLWWRAAPTRAVRNGLAGAVTALLAFRATPDVLLLAAGFTAPGESPLGTDSLLAALGWLMGLALVATSCWLAARGARGCPPRVLRAAATAALAVTMLWQVVTVVQLLIARTVIDPPRSVFRAVVWAINHTTWPLVAIVVAALVVPLAGWLAGRRTPAAVLNPAQARVRRAAAISRRHVLQTAFGVSALTVLVVTAGRAWDEREPQLSPAEPFDLEGDEATVPLETLADGHLHRFAYDAGGTEVRFIAIRKSDVSYGVGLDACQICGPTGYYESGGKVICRLCDVAMNIPTIGFAGGCNPIPLAYTLGQGRLRVLVSDLEDGAEVFA